MTQADLYTLLPIIVLVVWALALLLADLFIPKERKSLTAILAAAGLALTMGINLTQVGQTSVGFSRTIILDGIPTLVSMVVLDGFSILRNRGIVVAAGEMVDAARERGADRSHTTASAARAQSTRHGEE